MFLLLCFFLFSTPKLFRQDDNRLSALLFSRLIIILLDSISSLFLISNQTCVRVPLILSRRRPCSSGCGAGLWRLRGGP